MSRNMPRGRSHTSIPYFGHNQFPPVPSDGMMPPMQRTMCFPEEFSKIGQCGIPMNDFKPPMMVTPAPPAPTQPKKKRRQSAAQTAAAQAAAAAAAAANHPSPSQSMADSPLAPPPLTGYGDTIVASNPFEDGPSPSSPMLSPHMMSLNHGPGHRHSPQPPTPHSRILPNACMGSPCGPMMPGGCVPPMMTRPLRHHGPVVRGGIPMDCGPQKSRNMPVGMMPMHGGPPPELMGGIPNGRMETLGEPPHGGPPHGGPPDMCGIQCSHNHVAVARNNMIRGMRPPTQDMPPPPSPHCLGNFAAYNAQFRSRCGPPGPGGPMPNPGIGMENNNPNRLPPPTGEPPGGQFLRHMSTMVNVMSGGPTSNGPNGGPSNGTNNGPSNGPISGPNPNLPIKVERPESNPHPNQENDSGGGGGGTNSGPASCGPPSVKSEPETKISPNSQRPPSRDRNGGGPNNIHNDTTHGPNSFGPSRPQDNEHPASVANNHVFPRPLAVSSSKVYPADKSKVFNTQNPNAPPIYPCGICHKEVIDNDHALMCESGCHFWFHRSCTGLTEQAFILLRKEVYAEWACDNCINHKSVPWVKVKP